MMGRGFLTIPEELLEWAEAAADWFEQHGYRLKLEPNEIGTPYTPAFRCKRNATTIYVEVARAISSDRMDEWSRFARSRTRDTRIALVIPANSRIPSEETKLREIGVGLYECTPMPVGVMELIPPRDLAINVALPDLASLPTKIQRLLGAAYEQFERSQWREGFEDACQTLEVCSRRYLVRGIKANRVVILDQNGLPKTPTVKQIDKMTMGALADTFARIQAQNHADAKIGQVLLETNKDRVGVVHHKGKAKTENRLRKNVGRHMWSVVDALKALI